MKTVKGIMWVAIATLMGFSFSACEDDDNNNSNSDQDQLQDVAVSSVWIIKNFNDSGDDETADFACFSFEFQTDGTITATSPSVTYTGTWSITESSSDDDDDELDDLDFNINFNLTNEFEDLDDDWEIISYTNNIIQLSDTSGGDGSVDLLTFEVGSPNTTNCNSALIAEIENNATAGSWRITLFEEDGVNETSNFSGYDFNFGANAVLTASNGGSQETGTWSVTSSSPGGSGGLSDIDFNINFNVAASNDFDDLNDDWDVISQSAVKIELQDVSGGNGTTDLLTFEKN